jgi:hypothetical protein
MVKKSPLESQFMFKLNFGGSFSFFPKAAFMEANVHAVDDVDLVQLEVQHSPAGLHPTQPRQSFLPHSRTEKKVQLERH